MTVTEKNDLVSGMGRENYDQHLPAAVAVELLSDDIVQQQQQQQQYPIPVVQVVYQQSATDDPPLRDNRDVQCCYPVSVRLSAHTHPHTHL